MRLLAAICILVPALAIAQPPQSFHDLPIAEPATRPFTERVAAQVASDGDGFLAVWEDPRAFNRDIYGARFTAAGEPVDPEGFVVHATYEQESSPSAVWNGSDYAVFTSSSILGVWNTLVSPGKEVRGAPGERLGTQNAATFAAWSGTRYGQTSVTFNGTANTLELVLRDAQFAIVRRVALSDRVPPNIRPRVATDGRVFLVVWDDLQNLFAAVVDGDGNVTTPPFVLAPTGTGADAAWNGTSFLVTFSAADGVRAVAVGPDGTPGAQKLVAEETRLPMTAVAWNGHAHLVLWSTFDETGGALVTASGDPIETFDVADRGGVAPAIASNGDVFFAVVAGETLVIRSTGPARIVRRGPLANVYAQQSLPALAAGTTNVLTAWAEGNSIWMNRRTRAGAALDGSGVLVASAAHNVLDVKVFAARGFYVIAWRMSFNEIRIARVTEAGEVIDPGGIELATSGTEAVVAGNAAETRVVWGRLVSAVPIAMTELVTATLPERGPLGTPGIVALPVAPLGRSRAVRLFGNGDRFTLLYEAALPGSRLFAVDYEYRSLVIDAAGRASAPVTLVQRILAFDGATDGRSIVITWRDDTRQFTRRLDLDGVPAGAPVALDTPGSPFFSRIERTATGFVVLHHAGPRVMAAHVDRDGHPLAPPAAFIDDENSLLLDAAFVGGQTWVTYTRRWAPLPGVHLGTIPRAWLHVMGPRRRPAR